MRSVKSQIIKAQCQAIDELALSIMHGATLAKEHVAQGEINIAISYMLEIALQVETIKSLVDATIAIHRIVKEE